MKVKIGRGALDEFHQRTQFFVRFSRDRSFSPFVPLTVSMCTRRRGGARHGLSLSAIFETRTATCFVTLVTIVSLRLLPCGQPYSTAILNLIAEFYLVDRGLRHRVPGFSSMGRLVSFRVALARKTFLEFWI
jgi:hypothetical protein